MNTSQYKELGERIAVLEGEMKHLATRDFVRELIVEQTKELNAKFEEQTLALREEMKETVGELRDEMKESVGDLRDEMKESVGELRDEMRESVGSLSSQVSGIKSWQNRITGGGAALAVLVSLAVAIGNLLIIANRLT